MKMATNAFLHARTRKRGRFLLNNNNYTALAASRCSLIALVLGLPPPPQLLGKIEKASLGNPCDENDAAVVGERSRTADSHLFRGSKHNHSAPRGIDFSLSAYHAY